MTAGRWTNEEHRLFLHGLQLHNKQWKLIADLVKTRTVVQIRTHAQKYFQKLEKMSQSKQRSDSIVSDVSISVFCSF
jgi:SHAQKYF class myb-like DNA-binding protein